MYVLMYALVKLLHSHFVRMALEKWLKKKQQQQQQVQIGSAKFGTMPPTLSLTHHSLLIFNVVFIHLLHLTGLMNQTKHLHRVITQQVTGCKGYTCSTGLLWSSSGRGKACRWTRWDEVNVSSYRALTMYLCVVYLKNHFLFITRLTFQCCGNV